MSAVADWAQTRELARLLGAESPLAASVLSLEGAVGRRSAHDVSARAALPAWDSAAMDGWAVAGPPPWSLLDAIHAGDPSTAALQAGTARPIATGAPVPEGTHGILRLEHGTTTEGRLRATPEHSGAPRAGDHIRRRGEELREGERLIDAGQPLTAALVALAASAGYGELTVAARPSVEVLVLGDELRTAGTPAAPGTVVDVLSLVLPALIAAAGGELVAIRRLPDNATLLSAALSDATADLVVTTGGTGPGRRDHVAASLDAIGAELLVHGVAMRPGHPVLLARSGTGAVLGLPGNPLAAAATFLSFAPPFLRSRSALPARALDTIALTDAVENPTAGVRLIVVDVDGRPVSHQGSAMLRGLAGGIGFAVIPAGGADAGQSLPLLRMPG